MNHFLKFISVFCLSLLIAFAVSAQDRFDRSAEIPADLANGDIGGFGNIVAGVDLDGDGKLEIYAVNNDVFDLAGLDYIPRIYKYEQNADGIWEVVWWTKLALTAQNTWPALAVADLDKDGKGEIVWGPVNNFDGGANPERIVVYETPGDGSDVMGIAAGDYYRPNAQWTITDTDDYDLRPFRWLINDIDNDGTDEIVTALRGGDQRGQIYSVDNIPDTGDSSEVWTLEWEGLGAVTQYDLAIIGPNTYYISSGGDVTKVTYDAVGDSFIVSDSQSRLVGDGVDDGGSWNSATTIDADGNEQEEIIVVSWDSGSRNVYLLQEDGDSLIVSVIEALPSSSNRLYGGAAGDLDNDGLVDFVFGTRQSTPNGIIHRLEYQGGAVDDANNWKLTIIDQEANAGTQYDVIAMADLDADGEDEVLYTGYARGVTLGDPPQPIVILDRVPANQPVITKVLDVPNDQGRQVWVVWKASADDMVPPLDKTASIGIIAPKGVDFPFATINGVPVNAVRINQEVSSIAAAGDIIDYAVWRIDNEDNLVQVSATRAAQFDMYAAVVPTLGDGDDWKAVFMVTAHTAIPAVNWKSFEKTGTSEDNLIPAAPGKVAAKEVEATIEVTWEESPDADFKYFSIRRGTESGFNAADLSTQIGTTTGISFIDAEVEGDAQYYYRVVAFDFNGNQGELSEEVSAIVSAIDGFAQTIPTVFALDQNYPNPFNPTTTIAFDLPQNVDVSIVIFNALGRKVRTLVNEAKAAGSYRVSWNGINDNGIKVATGIYIYTIRAGEFVESRRMTLIK